MIKRCLNLTTVATLVIATLSYNFTYAQISANSSTKNYNSKNTNDDVRIFINNQQRSLYQIALLWNYVNLIKVIMIISMSSK